MRSHRRERHDPFAAPIRCRARYRATPSAVTGAVRRSRISGRSVTPESTACPALGEYQIGDPRAKRLASALAEHHAPFRPGSRKGAAQLGQHRRIGLDRDDFGTQRDQRGGQLAGSGAEVEHSRAGRGLGRPARRGLGVVRPVLSVGGRRYPRATTREVAVRPLPRGYSICQGKPRPDRIGKP